MKLASFRITNFQSIRDSNVCEIGDITCLVGKNEAGKTAILRALYRLNPLVASEGNFDETDDYPRMEVEEYKYAVESGATPAQVVQACFTLEEDDLRPIQQHFGNDVLLNPELRLSKGYDNRCSVSLDVNLQTALAALFSNVILPVKTQAALSNVSTLEAAIEFLNAQQQQSPESRSLRETLSGIQARGLDGYIYDTFLASRVPKFLYFDEYCQMRGHENIEALIERQRSGTLKKSDHPMLGLIELARLRLPDLLNLRRTQELKNRIEGAGNHLGKQVLKYWSQNRHLDMSFDVRPASPGDPEGMTAGTNIWAEIYDSRHKVTTGAGARSRGFVWFFSFLAWYSRLQKENQPLVLLLDEPGLSLHAKAQEDLLRYFEEEVKGVHQLIYTTHSPFMVDPRHIDRVRIVQDKSIDTTDPLPPEEDGTKVLSDIFEATSESLFPLQGALGYEMYETLLAGPNSLIVKGVPDLVYLQIVSSTLQKQGRSGLSDRWTILPVGGTDKIPTFLALVAAQRGLRVATLIDVDRKDGDRVGNLNQRALLKKSNVLSLSDFTGKLESDIEDMFDEAFFLELVNAEFKASLQKAISATDLDGYIPRINARLEAYFRATPMRNGVSYSHYRPARYFSERVTTLESRISKETFDRFEAAFNALNALLER
jgi:energy-coupling factor transporter ATP-binding protein EcfA2